jgi:16S rRNA (cytosine967-C5)-methyltransferase
MSPGQDKPYRNRPDRKPARPQNRAQAPRRKPLDPARRAAFDVLRAVSERSAYANLVLPRCCVNGVSPVATRRSPPS